MLCAAKWSWMRLLQRTSFFVTTGGRFVDCDLTCLFNLTSRFPKGAFGQGRPSNSMNPSSSYWRIIRKHVKTHFGILFPVFTLNTTLKSNAMRHFAANFPRAWESRNHLTSSPQRALRANQNGHRGEVRTRLLRGEKEKSKTKEHFSVRKIYFRRLKEHFGVRAGSLFWVCEKRLGCPRLNFVSSWWEATGVSSLEICLEFVRSDWGVLAGILFWLWEIRPRCPRFKICLEIMRSDWGVLVGILFEVYEKRLRCPRWNFVWLLWEATIQYNTLFKR